MAALTRSLFSLRSSSTGLRRLCSSERRHDLAAPPLQLLREVVIDGAGGLDEMESALDKLQISVSPSLAAELFESEGAGAGATRRLLRFLSWSGRRSHGGAAEEAAWWENPFRQAIQCFLNNGDAAAMGILISELHRRRRQMPRDVFSSAAESLVKLRRPEDALRLLNLQREEGRHQGRMILAVVHALCGGGHAASAAKLMARLRAEISPAEAAAARRYLLHGWCRGRNAREARKVLEEMKSSGEAPGGAAYHALLRCLCERNLKFNPAALLPEAFSVVAEMRAAGELPTAATINLLLSCLVRARRVKEALNILQSMRRRENARPPPDWVSYYHVTRVMFLTGRWVKGKRIIRQMAEDGVAAPPGFFRRLIGLLCGVEKMEFALEVFDEMSQRNFRGGELGMAYEMLIEKLCRGGRFDDGRRLWEEAAVRGVLLRCSPELLDPSKTEVFSPAAKQDDDDGYMKKMISKKKRKMMKKK